MDKTVLAKIGVNVEAWLARGSIPEPEEGDRSVPVRARPAAADPEAGLARRGRSLPTWRRGFVRAGAEPTEEAGLRGPGA